MFGDASFADDWLHGLIRRPAAGPRHTTVARPGAPAGGAPLRVVKIGGSLLSRRGWPHLIGALVGSWKVGPCCLVVGGGAVVEGLRTIDRAEPRAPAIMHDLSIDAMRLTARLVAAAVGLPMQSSPPDSRGVAVLDVPAWLAEGIRASSLPIGWHVTSDTIAASVAVEHGGGLLLAKSAPPPPCPEADEPLAGLAAAGWVDGHFPIAAATLAEIAWAAPANVASA